MKVVVKSAHRNIKAHEDFYTKMKFFQERFDDRIFYKCQDLIIETTSNKYARNCIDLYLEEEKMKTLISQLPYKDSEEAYVFCSPSGVRVNLVKEKLALSNDLKEISSLGKYCGVSIESINIAASQEFWTALGFEKFMGDANQGWVSLKNKEGYTISVMDINSCPHVFTNPSLTFFNGKNNPMIIEEIRKCEIPIAEEITEFNKDGLVDNIVIRDPGGLGMFIFNDEVY